MSTLEPPTSNPVAGMTAAQTSQVIAGLVAAAELDGDVDPGRAQELVRAVEDAARLVRPTAEWLEGPAADSLVYALRTAGRSWDEIASTMGYGTGSGRSTTSVRVRYDREAARRSTARTRTLVPTEADLLVQVRAAVAAGDRLGIYQTLRVAGEILGPSGLVSLWNVASGKDVVGEGQD
jgi:hypothetical protein